MRITVLGSGSAYSSAARFNSCYLVESGKNRLLLDCGSDALRALQKSGIDILEVDNILITHLHADHCGGLPAVLTAMHVACRKKAIEVYVPGGQIDFVKSWLSNLFIYDGRMSFDIALRPIAGGQMNLGNGTVIESIRTTHLDKYSEFNRRNGIGASSFMIVINDGTTSFFFSSDIGSIDEVTGRMRGRALSLVESTHLSLDEIAVMARSNNGTLYFTHIPMEMEEGGEWRRELNEKFGIHKLNLAYDGQVLNI